MPVRIGINLSREPFRRDRPVVVASTLVGLLLAGLLVALVWLTFFQRGEAAQTREAIARLESRARAMTAEQSELETALQRPENAAVLEQVLFVNSLLYRKGISWTKIFADLESVMPYNVRLISLRPRVGPQNQVMLDMVVGSQSQAPVIEMLKNMVSSPLFGATEVPSWLPPAQQEPLFRYRVSVRYGQKL